jgi:2-polyprenyl-3-methyl-5-hydroxy-6-metoxy-1,4-benzoquinol methylase
LSQPAHDLPMLNPGDDQSYDFGRKYNRAGFVARRLLDGFFGTIEQLTKGLGIKSALEIGCGEGFSTQRLRMMLPADATLQASDIEQRNVDAARARNPDVQIARESIYRLAREDRCVDLVLALEVLEHLDEPAAALRELCRVSRRWVMVSTPREPLWRIINLMQLKYVAALGNTPGHIQHWSSRGLSRLVGQHAQVLACRKPFRWTIILAEVKP